MLASRESDTVAEYEELTEDNPKRPAFILTFSEIKLLGVVGVGFFLDAYDLFIINPVSLMLQYRLYGGKSLPPGLEGFLKASANIGNIVGQFLFGYLADVFGRKAVYGKELILVIVATILTLTTPTGSLSPNNSLIYLSIFRILLGVGVGGDYPMSASILSDRAVIRRRGTLLAYNVSHQGWGNFTGGLATVVVLAAYKHTMESNPAHISKVDGVWRIVIALSLIPAFATLYQRLKMPESKRFIASQKLIALPVDHTNEVKQDASSVHKEDSKDFIEQAGNDEYLTRTADFKELLAYFSEWRHAKLLIATCLCWFLLDVAFYGINLNQNFVLQQIRFDGSEGTPWHRLFKISTGNIIITALGLLPGYYATILTIEWLGRKWLQIQGFLMAALFLGILAGMFNTLSKPAFIVCFALLQFFFNFGANMTIYIIPAELFPTRYRASAHGISAALGKAGAIVSALAFNSLSKKVGTPAILWIFFGCCIAGAVITLALPEVKGRDPDLILMEERKQDRRIGRST